MKFFREQTLNQIVVMGKNTFLSLGSKPLPNRVNIVLTDEFISVKNVIQIFDKTLEEALQYIDNLNESSTDIYIIGGAYVYNQAISQKLADELLLTIMIISHHIVHH